MAINERIKFIRNLRGQTQKWLGMAIGFPEKTADIRVAQYETGARTPKEKMVNEIARALDVRPEALSVPDIDSYDGLIHTLFALEDLYGFKIDKSDAQLSITLDQNSSSYHTLTPLLSAWHEQAEKLKNGKITQEEYNNWRYNYPESEWQNTKTKLDEIRTKRKAD